MGTFCNFLNKEEKKQSINEVDIQPAVDRGLMAYWREIKMSFPNARSIDIMPDIADEFRKAATKATQAWLQVNTNPPSKDALVSFSSFNRNPYATQTSQWNDYHP